MKFGIKAASIVLVGMLSILFCLTSCTHTETVRNEKGEKLELAIDTRETLRINGTNQSIYVAGTKKENPLLLWLDGGPGGSELGWVRSYLGPLHEHFTIVCYDQRGTSASYGAGKKSLLVEDFVQDVLELSDHLLKQYNQDKLYLLGHSWGGFIGALSVQKRPELFHAFIAASPHVNSTENDTIGYHMILEGAKKRGDLKTVKELEDLGPPPYETIDEEGVAIGDGDAYYAVLSRLYSYSPKAPSDGYFRSEKMFLAPEHSLMSRINLIRGLLQGVKEVYPQIRDRSLEVEVKELQCPLYVINGRYDMSCVASITERWFDSVSAPKKQMMYLEDSGHNGVYTEAAKFMQFMEEVVAPTKE